MTNDAHRFLRAASVLAPGEDARDPRVHARLLAQGILPLVEGKTFWHYDDRWKDPPRYVVPVERLQDRAHVLRACPYYRSAYRDIASATNERTLVYAMLPPGVAVGHTAAAERAPFNRPAAVMLSLLAVCNSFPADYLIRLRAAAHVSLFMMERTPVPGALVPHALTAHSALRLSCNHEGYAALWREQLGDVWRERGPRFEWPALATEEERWEVRAAVDAAVAHAYGLSREQYEHVLSTFSHRSYPKAPALCRARFDELTAIGLEAFTRKHDPYHDIPLNENLPQPVIDLPGQGSGVGGQDSGERPTNLLGEPLPVNLLGEVEYGGGRRRRRGRGG